MLNLSPRKTLLFFVALSIGLAGTARADLLGFNRFTENMGERIWKFESNCPKVEQEREFSSASISTSVSTCLANGKKINLTLPSALISDLQFSAQQIDEWLWVQSAVRIRKEVMSENLKHLSFMENVLESPRFAAKHPELPELKDEISRISENILALATLDGALEAGIGLRPNILAAREELLRQTPIIAHQQFEKIIDTVKRVVAKGYHGKQLSDFLKSISGLTKKALREAIKDTKSAITRKLHQYDKIIKERDLDGSYVDGLLHDQTLLEELLIMEDDPIVGQTPTEKMSINNTRCRLTNRVLKGKAMAELRALFYNSAFMLTSLGAGAVLSSGRAFFSLHTLARETPLVVPRVAITVLEAGDVHTTMNRCNELKALALAGISENSKSTESENSKRVRAFLSCKDLLGDQAVMGALGTVSTGLGAYSILRPRVMKRYMKMLGH